MNGVADIHCGTSMSVVGPIQVFNATRLWIAVDDATSMRTHSSATTACALTADRSRIELDDDCADQLSDGDRIRWERYRLPQKRRQFLLSRCLLARVIAIESQRLNSILHVVSRLDGRPECRNSEGDEVLSISLAHSGPMVALAVAELPARIGVDLEIVRPFRATAVAQMLEVAAEVPANSPGFDSPDTEAERIRSLWVAAEAAWKTDPDQFRLGSIDWRAGLATADCHAGDADEMESMAGILHSQLIVAGCEPLTSATIRLVDEGSFIPFRGCVTIRLPRRLTRCCDRP